MTRLVLFFLALFLVNGCGSTDNSTAPEVGGISFNTSWPTKQLPYSMAKTVLAAMPDTITIVRASISGPSMTAVQMDFQADAHQGTISNIPAGVNRTFTLQGLDSTGQPIYSGTISGITIVSNVTTNAGTLVMQRIINNNPVAQAGLDQNINTGTIVTLDGSGSSDDGDAIAYSWTISEKPVNSKAVLSNATLVKPTFSADKDGRYIVSLTITDSSGAVSISDSVLVTATTPVGAINFSW